MAGSQPAARLVSRSQPCPASGSCWALVGTAPVPPRVSSFGVQLGMRLHGGSAQAGAGPSDGPPRSPQPPLPPRLVCGGRRQQEHCSPAASCISFIVSFVLYLIFCFKPVEERWANQRWLLIYYLWRIISRFNRVSCPLPIHRH